MLKITDREIYLNIVWILQFDIFQPKRNEYQVGNFVQSSHVGNYN